MTFVEDLRRRADLSGTSLTRLDAGRDRYGPVAAILLATSRFASVRLRNDGSAAVLVWADDELVAFGHTPSLDDIVATMRFWQDGLPIRDLCEALRYLEAADPQTMVETLWGVLVDYGEPYLHAIVTAAAANPTLRALRPWISHGTLHLLHPDDRVSGVRRGLAFHPTAQARFRVHIYDGPIGPAENAASAVTTAASTAVAW